MIYRLINKKGIGLTGNTKKRTKPHKDSCRDIAFLFWVHFKG